MLLLMFLIFFLVIHTAIMMRSEDSYVLKELPWIKMIQRISSPALI